MIIRSGLIRNKDDVSFSDFARHWRETHGPLALRVQGMRAYSQNHITERLLPVESPALHRVDGISQLYFDDVDAMRVAMMSDEQAACIEDLRSFLSHVTLVIQEEGNLRRIGNLANARPKSKAMFLMGGDRKNLSAFANELTDQFERSGFDGALRFHPVIDRSFDVDASIPAGSQVVDAILETWSDSVETVIPNLFDPHFIDGNSKIYAAFKVDEHIFL
jgi:uncharacterized protein (TIGR02118 family)